MTSGVAGISRDRASAGPPAIILIVETVRRRYVMRINRVKKSRTDQGVCGKCQNPLPVGVSYQWIKPRFGAKRVRCWGFPRTDCGFQNSDLTTSDKLSNWWLAIEDVEGAVKEARELADGVSLEEMAGHLKGVVEVIDNSLGMLETVSEGYSESADNMYDAFPGGSMQIDECEEKSQAAEEKRDELDDAKTEIEEVIADFEGDNPTPSNFERVLSVLDDTLCGLGPD